MTGGHAGTPPAEARARAERASADSASVESARVQSAQPIGGTGERDPKSDPARATARQLWESLCRARNDQAPQTQANLEDAVFGYYLPRARAIAGRLHAEGNDAESPDHTAELALAKAVLAWHRDDEGFDRFLRASITSELRTLDRRRRAGPSPGSSGRPEVSGSTVRSARQLPAPGGPPDLR